MPTRISDAQLRKGCIAGNDGHNPTSKNVYWNDQKGTGQTVVIQPLSYKHKEKTKGKCDVLAKKNNQPAPSTISKATYHPGCLVGGTDQNNVYWNRVTKEACAQAKRSHSRANKDFQEKCKQF